MLTALHALGGRKVWIVERGDAPETVVLLHGGMGQSDELLDSIGRPLGEHYRLVAFDRRGHGRTADTDAAFSYDDMATEAIAVLEATCAGRTTHLVGWSDGGIVALRIALRRPELFSRQVVIGANYHKDGAREMSRDSGVALRGRMKAAYAERSPDGAAHYPVVRDKMLDLMTREPSMTTADLARIPHTTLVLVGDDDIIELGHTVSLYEHLPAGQLAVVPRATHAVALEHPTEVADLIRAFLRAPSPVETMMPSRRPHH